MLAAVQELEKEGAKAISLQPDEPIKFHDENFVMGEYQPASTKRRQRVFKRCYFSSSLFPNLPSHPLSLLPLSFPLAPPLAPSLSTTTSAVGEERMVVQPNALEEPAVKELITVS